MRSLIANSPWGVGVEGSPTTTGKRRTTVPAKRTSAARAPVETTTRQRVRRTRV
jgi:hypothetical protein